MYSLFMSFNLYLDETAVGKSMVVYRHAHPWRSRAGSPQHHKRTSVGLAIVLTNCLMI
jgi:ribosomal protein S4E